MKTKIKKSEKSDRLLTPGEVADLFRVDPKTVTRWIKDGRLPRDHYLWTPGGHARFWESKMLDILHNGGESDD